MLYPVINKYQILEFLLFISYVLGTMCIKKV